MLPANGFILTGIVNHQVIEDKPKEPEIEVAKEKPNIKNEEEFETPTEAFLWAMKHGRPKYKEWRI